MGSEQTRLGILVGGGPAPGINSVISACAIEANKSGVEVVGIYDGFSRLIEGDATMTTPLGIPDVSRIHSQGGSVLRTSRANPARDARSLERCVQTLKTLGIAYLVTIGGDDTAFAASEVAKVAGGALRVVHVPKTIDNDRIAGDRGAAELHVDARADRFDQRAQEEGGQEADPAHDGRQTGASAGGDAGRALDVARDRARPEQCTHCGADRVSRQRAARARQLPVPQQPGLIGDPDQRAHRVEQIEQEEDRDDREPVRQRAREEPGEVELEGGFAWRGRCAEEAAELHQLDAFDERARCPAGQCRGQDPEQQGTGYSTGWSTTIPPH